MGERQRRMPPDAMAVDTGGHGPDTRDIPPCLYKAGPVLHCLPRVTAAPRAAFLRKMGRGRAPRTPGATLDAPCARLKSCRGEDGWMAGHAGLAAGESGETFHLLTFLTYVSPLEWMNNYRRRHEINWIRHKLPGDVLDREQTK